MARLWVHSERIVETLDGNSPYFFFRYRLHPERGYEYVGRAVTAIKGYTPEDHYADPDLPLKIIAPEDRERLVRFLANPLGAEIPLVLHWRRKDGATIRMHTWAFPVQDQDGRIVAIEGVSHDVTGWTRSPPVLRDANALLGALGEAALVMGPDGTVLYANRGAEVRFRCTPGGLLGRQALELWAPEAYATAIAAHEATQRGEPWYGTVPARRNDGTTFTAWVTMAPVCDGAGRVLGKIVLTLDAGTREIAERAAEAAHAHAERLLALSPAVLYTADATPPFAVTYISGNVQAQLGYAPAEFVGDTDFWADRLHPDDRDDVFAGLSQVLESGHHVHEYRFRHTDGSYRWMRDELRLIRYPDGSPQELVGYWVDITPRKAAEEELERFFSLSLDLLGIADYDGYFRRLNPAWTETLGWEVEDLLGRPYVEFVHPDDRERTAREAARIVEEQSETRAFENRYRCKDGSYRWIHWKSTPVPEQRLIYFCARDITRRKDAEERLRRAHEDAETLVRERTKDLERSTRQYRDIFDHAPLGICQTTPEGRILAANAAFARMLGYEVADELVGTDVNGVYVHPEDRAQLVERLDAGEYVTGQELEWVRRDGARIWVQLDVVPVPGAQGATRYYQAFVRDVTQRRSLEEQLQHSQRMEAVGTLAGGVAHDFNNLLTAILGNVELLLMDLDDAEPMSEDLREIRSAAQRAAALTQQLLAFSRKQVTRPTVLDLSEVVGQLEKMLRRLLGEDVELHIVPAPSDALVEADRGQVEQVVVNLAVNARDAMPRGGKLTIEVSGVTLDQEYAAAHAEVEPGEHVLLSVSDTGVGMDEETRRHIFDPFFTTKEAGKGTGLGLSTVYGIVKQNRGHIWVYSEPKVGTVFKIYLPRATEGVATPVETAPRPAPRGGQETVLVVEDERGVRDLAAKALRRFGYQVLEAANAGEALLTCEQHDGPIHLLLTDVVMPRMGGSELLERVQALRPEMRVLYMSGYTDDAIVRHGVLREGVPFLQKPFTPTQLTEAVRDVLDRAI